MYTLAPIGGIKFSKCLVDAGSETNVISIGDVIKHGLSFLPGGVHALRDFDNQKVLVQGVFTSHVIVGLAIEPKELVFHVTANATIPFIFLPTLKAFRLTVDCGSHKLCDPSSRKAEEN